MSQRFTSHLLLVVLGLSLSAWWLQPGQLAAQSAGPQFSETEVGPQLTPNNRALLLDESVLVFDTETDADDLATDTLTDTVTDTDAPADQPGTASPVNEADAVPHPQAHTALSQTPLPPELANLRDRLRKVLAMYYPKHLNSRDHSCWELMHGIIAYGVDAKVFVTQPGGKTANAIGWMCYNQPCHGEQLFFLDRGNQLVARKGPGLQGHLGQFMAIIAQSHVPADFPMKVGGKAFTVQDLIEHEKLDCRAGEELTFKLIGLSHYLDSDATWKSANGQTWSIQRLIQEELKQPILRVAACGGTHRLMGHSYALYKRRKQGKPIDGQFARAEKFIADYHKYSFSLQNADGSFSTKWFEMKEARPDIDRRLKTTGHIFEWMAFSVAEEQLRDPRMVKAANYLVNLLASQPNRQWEVGPLGHGLHALRIYDRRLFKPYDTAAPTVTPPTEQPAAEPLADKPVSEVWVDDAAPAATANNPATTGPGANAKPPVAKPNLPKQPTAGPILPSQAPIRTARKPAPTTSTSPRPRLVLPAPTGTTSEQPKPAKSAPGAPDVPPIELLP
jgi:hypothetical protein